MSLGPPPRFAVWREIHQPEHWVVQVGLRLFHYYGPLRSGTRHFYRTTLRSTSDELNWVENSPEFRMVAGV